MDEYLAREERYDKQMKEKIGVDPAGKALGPEFRLWQISFGSEPSKAVHTAW